MKLDQKWPNAPTGIEHGYRDECTEYMKVEEIGHCNTGLGGCGEPTQFIDVLFEGPYVCSTECAQKMWQGYFDACEAAPCCEGDGPCCK